MWHDNFQMKICEFYIIFLLIGMEMTWPSRLPFLSFLLSSSSSLLFLPVEIATSVSLFNTIRLLLHHCSTRRRTSLSANPSRFGMNEHVTLDFEQCFIWDRGFFLQIWNSSFILARFVTNRVRFVPWSRTPFIPQTNPFKTTLRGKGNNPFQSTIRLFQIWIGWHREGSTTSWSMK